MAQTLARGLQAFCGQRQGLIRPTRVSESVVAASVGGQRQGLLYKAIRSKTEGGSGMQLRQDTPTYDLIL
jgi:hypothetical protein